MMSLSDFGCELYEVFDILPLFVFLMCSHFSHLFGLKKTFASSGQGLPVTTLDQEQERTEHCAWRNTGPDCGS